MKNVISIGLILSCLIFAACNNFKGDPGQLGNAGTPGGDCNVVNVPVSTTYPNGGALITCPESSTFLSNGSTGATGLTGNAGQNGVGIVVETLTAPSGQCADGGSVILVAQDTLGTGLYNTSDVQETSVLVCDGLNGATGAQGQQGDAGSNGTNGTNATPITTVQFCPNVTSYSSTFSEVGFCLGGQVYGVYSQNDGFMSLLPPGEYTSDGINSSCNFTIGANCKVTH